LLIGEPTAELIKKEIGSALKNIIRPNVASTW
jgi:actin-like ATPase involved in cell morphogenesis